MTEHHARSTDPELSTRMAGALRPGTTVLAHARWYRVLAAHVAADGGLDLDVEARNPIDVRMLDLGAALGVILHLHEPAEPEWRTYTIARGWLAAEDWARSQSETGWSEWRGSNGSEPWHYLPLPAVQLRGLSPKRMRVVLVDFEDYEVDEPTRAQLAVLAGMGARIEVHHDAWRYSETRPQQRWASHLAFARVPVPAEEA